MLTKKRCIGTSGVVTTIVFCAFLFLYGPALFGLLYTKWETRNSPELWIVPTPLTDLSIDRSPGKKFSYLGYEFESPWTEVKKERKGESIVVLNFSDGEVISISISNGTDGLKIMKQEATRRGADIRNVFGDEATSSNYALRSKILYVTPRDLRLFSSRREMVANSIFLILKRVWTTNAKSGMYSFQTEAFRGFQVGSPTKTNAVQIYAFDAQDREINLIIGAEPKANNKPSQAEINRIVYSLRIIPFSSTK
jgi:hypothetical protein